MFEGGSTAKPNFCVSFVSPDFLYNYISCHAKVRICHTTEDKVLESVGRQVGGEQGVDSFPAILPPTASSASESPAASTWLGRGYIGRLVKASLACYDTGRYGDYTVVFLVF